MLPEPPVPVEVRVALAERMTSSPKNCVFEVLMVPQLLSVVPPTSVRAACSAPSCSPPGPGNS